MSTFDNFERLFQRGEDALSPEKVILKFFDTQNINLKTEIPSRMLIPLTSLESYSKLLERKYCNEEFIEKYGDSFKEVIELINSMVQLIKEEMVSLDRQGRQEGERMVGSLREQLATKNVLGKIFGVE